MGVIPSRARNLSTTDAVHSMSEYYVYMLTNVSGTLYVGVTSDLHRRVFQHRQKLVEGFTRKYNVTMLV